MKKPDWTEFDRMTGKLYDPSLQIKCHYYSLIQYELQKLTEEQLYKVFVLVKNTTSDVVKSVPAPTNQILLDPTIKANVPPEWSSTHESSKILKKWLLDKNLTGGYGIFSMFGRSSAGISISEYICFCVPFYVDFMVENVSPQHPAVDVFILTTRHVGVGVKSSKAFFNIYTLSLEIDNIVKQYNKQNNE